jgi:hypothetical protein
MSVEGTQIVKLVSGFYEDVRPALLTSALRI